MQKNILKFTAPTNPSIYFVMCPQCLRPGLSCEQLTKALGDQLSHCRTGMGARHIPSDLYNLNTALACIC